jgi:hypothetical protein
VVAGDALERCRLRPGDWIMAHPAFDEESVLRDACEAAGGLSDFGRDDFREGLRVLLATYAANDWTEKGHRQNRRRVVRLLASRLKIEAAFRRHREIRKRPIAKPMVLTGLPRSGTSALFNLLATDPDARALLLWETQFPEPAEGLAAGARDPRRDMVEEFYRQSREKNPEFTKIHFASANTPEECVLLHAYALHGVHIGIEIMLEPYGSWFRAQDLRTMYGYYRDLLRLLDWQRPGKRWLLKAPAHMWGIDALIETFPDVSIVWSHRDPVACTASICSMTHALFGAKKQVDPAWLGPVVMDWYASSLERGLSVRDRCDPGRFVDVTHDEFVEDSMTAVERIYHWFDMPLPDAARSEMARHIAENPRGKHGAHRYDLETYGLTREMVVARFAPYIERFRIELEPVVGP